MQNINTLLIVSVALLGSLIFYLAKKNKKSQKQQVEQSTIIKQISLENKPKITQTKNEGQQAIQKKKSKKKKKSLKQEGNIVQSRIKTQKQIQQVYSDIFYGSISLQLKSSNIYKPTAICFKNSKILISNTKNELILYDLKKWKKQNPSSLQKYFVSLDNNTGTAVAIGTKNYYVALNFDKTIAYYQFVGQKGEYFRLVKKFNRNILKSDAKSIFVPEDQKYIITAGSQADTTINIWAMNGDKLHTLNTYQIQHYDILFSHQLIMVRGWTSQVKNFQIINDKFGNFSKIQKTCHLSLQDHPICSSIDNLSFYGLTVQKTFKITLWSLRAQKSSKPQLKIAQPYQIDLDQIQNCLIHTLRDENQRYKTLVIFSGNQKLIICDKELKVHQIIQGIQCLSLNIIGSMKNIVLINQNKEGKLYVWNLTKMVQQKIQQYTL